MSFLSGERFALNIWRPSRWYEHAWCEWEVMRLLYNKILFIFNWGNTNYAMHSHTVHKMDGFHHDALWQTKMSYRNPSFSIRHHTHTRHIYIYTHTCIYIYIFPINSTNHQLELGTSRGLHPFPTSQTEFLPGEITQWAPSAYGQTFTHLAGHEGGPEGIQEDGKYPVESGGTWKVVWKNPTSILVESETLHKSLGWENTSWFSRTHLKYYLHQFV